MKSYLPNVLANEMTSVVSLSGSGRLGSTITQLLLRMYDPQDGVVMLDERDMRFLDEEWLGDHLPVFGVFFFFESALLAFPVRWRRATPSVC
jgi:ABC-type multidrug transport system fused ATPase/permease subunit